MTYNKCPSHVLKADIYKCKKPTGYNSHIYLSNSFHHTCTSKPVEEQPRDLDKCLWNEMD